jgi:ATP synthase protein I
MKEPKKQNAWAQVGRYSQLAFVMPGCVVAGYAIGYYLDRYFETSFLYIVFLVLGIAAGFIELIREVQKDQID